MRRRSAANRWADELPRKWRPAASAISPAWCCSATRCIRRADPIGFARRTCRTSRRRCCLFKVRATLSEPLTSYVRSWRRSNRRSTSTSSKVATTHSRCGKEAASDRKPLTTPSRIISQLGSARWRRSGERDERARDRATQQGLARLPLGGTIEVREKLHLTAGKECHRQASAVEHPIAGQCRELWPRGQDAGEIKRVGAGERDPLIRRRLAPHRAQHADRVRKCELLTGEAGDKPAAADFASRLEPAIDAQQVAPWRHPGRLAFNQAPEHNPITKQQSPRQVLDGFGPALWQRLCTARQRPAAGVFHAEHSGAPAAPVAT